MQTKQDCVLWCAAECFRAEEVFVFFFFTCESFYVEGNFMKHRNVLLRSLATNGFQQKGQCWDGGAKEGEWGLVYGQAGEGGDFKGAENVWFSRALILLSVSLVLSPYRPRVALARTPVSHRQCWREELPLPSGWCLHNTTDTVFGFHSVKMHFLFYSSENWH